MSNSGACSAPPLIAPGQWHLHTGLPPVGWMRGTVYVVMASTVLLVLAWAAAWTMAWRDGQTPALQALLAVVSAAAWCVLAGRVLWRMRRPSPLVCLRWLPGERVKAAASAQWRVLNWGDRAVHTEVVFSVAGWRWLRLSQPSADPRVARQAWCWVPPVPAGADPRDLHRLSCLLTLKLGQFGALSPAVASSGGSHAPQGTTKRPVMKPTPVAPPPAAADTQFPDTVFADTVWMGEPPGIDRAGAPHGGVTKAA